MRDLPIVPAGTLLMSLSTVIVAINAQFLRRADLGVPGLPGPPSPRGGAATG